MATPSTRTPARMTPRAKTVDGYIAGAPKDKRPALMKLRKAIRAAAPKATEGISYGLVGYKHGGKRLVYFGYMKGHCGLYGDNARFLGAAERKRYVTSKGTIRFAADRPLPDPLVKKIVKARIAEIEHAEGHRGDVG